MLKFIELHAKDDKALLSINIENIVGFGVDDGAAVIRTIDKGGWFVAESYEEIKQLIQDAGILIHKPDPRLNLTKPLSIEDLSGMIGEPVWNSNNNQWLIMAHYLDNKENPIAGLYNKNGYLVEFTADDLIRTPLYRMKQEGK